MDPSHLYKQIGGLVRGVRPCCALRAVQSAMPFVAAVLGLWLSGCSTPQRMAEPDKAVTQADVKVDFSDPVLNSRKMLLFGGIDQRTAEIAVQKLLFLDGQGHAPIDLYLETPGGDMKYAWAIYQTMTLIHSPVNTYALSECNSGGAMLLAAGTGKRWAFHGAVIVLHGLAVHGKPPAGFVEDMQNSYTEFWRRRSHLPPSWLPLRFDSLRVLSAEQALECGIVDAIVDRSKTPPTVPESTAVGAGGSADAVADSIRRGSPVR